MKRSAVVFLVLCGCIAALGSAQQANQNINVLPVYFNEANDPTQDIDPDAYLKGDLFLQRQVEPTMAVSSWNSQHLIAFFNDYRAVDIPNDLGVGEEGSGASSSGTAEGIVAKVLNFFRKEKGGDRPALPEQAAASEAWVGGSRSYDGGITWTGFFVPGGPFDDSPASLASPLKGLEASTDPVAASGPCGTVYLAYLGFTRGETSKMVVSRWQDTNNLIGGDTWTYGGTAVLEVGNNAEFGFFLDKPHIATDYVRNGGGACDHNIYVSYTTFNGRERDGKFKSKVTFARSTGDELGFDTNFDVQKLNAPFQQNQGSWIVVNPLEGTPNTTGGGTIHLFWRHFFDPNAILTIKSTNYGQTFPGNPKNITAGWDLETYDQIGYSTTAAVNAGFPNEGIPNGGLTPWDPPANGGQAGVEDVISFRSNAFPTAAISPDGEEGTIFVAWQERVDVQLGDTQGFPAPWPVGTPRIVMTMSTDGGDTWKDVDGNLGSRKAVDFGRRDDPANPKAEIAEDGWGQLPQPRYSGPQVMPSFSCGLDRCMLIYSESRGFLWEAGSPSAGEQFIVPYDLSTSTSFISGIDRMMDMRAARIHPATGDLVSTTQISRYTLAPSSDATTPGGSETPEDIAAVNWPCSPDDVGVDPENPGPFPDCDRAINLPNKPQSAAGTTAFIGDYYYVVPLQSWTQDQQSGWRWAISASDLNSGAPAFHAIWADNRNLIPPKADPEWPEYQAYDFQFDPATGEISGTSGPCPTYWGAKNTDVLTARVDAPLILSLPNNFKQVCDGVDVPCDFPRSFPLLITNGTDTNINGDYGSRFYRVSFTGGEPYAAGGVSFSQFDPAFDWGDVELLPWSSSTAVVWVDPGNSEPVQVYVQEIDSIEGLPVPGGYSGIVTINDESAIGLVQNPGINTAEFNDLQVSNPQTSNPQTSNPQTSNPQTSNLFVANPQTSNPQTSNLTLTDSVTWTIQPGDTNVINSAGVAINIDNPELYQAAGVTFQMIIWSLTSNGGLDLDACSPVQTPQAQIISSITGDASLVTNPQTSNPQTSNTLISNPQTSNPQTSNPQTSNAAFTVAPADASPDAGVQGRAAGAESMAPTNDGTLKAALNKPEVFVTLLAYCDPVGSQENCEEIFKPKVDPPSILLRSLNCDEPLVKFPDGTINFEESCDFVSPSPDLTIASAETTIYSAVPSSVRAGTMATFPVADGCVPETDICRWTAFNDSQGTATPENGDLTHGVYLSESATIFLPNGSLDPDVVLIGPLIGGSVVQLPQFVASEGRPEPICPSFETGDCDFFPPGEEATFDAFDVVIPETTEPGSYYLHLWIDDGREISEFIEPNNVITAPIEVTAANAAPSNINIEIEVNAQEGTPVTLTVTFDDEGADPGDEYIYLWDFGDGNTCRSDIDEDCGASATHTYDEDGDYTVSVTVIDSGELEGGGSLVVTIENVAPTVDAGPDATINEGGTFASSGSFTDPGADSWTASVDYGDGAGPQALTLNGDKTFALSHVYADAGSYTVTVTVIDDDGSGSDSAEITVGNVAPSVNAGADATINEGGTFTSAGSFTDPGADTWTATVDYGDGAGAQPLTLSGQTFAFSHVYADSGIFTVTVNVADDDGGVGSDTATVTVNNVAPSVNAGADATINEGGTFTSAGSFTDPGADGWTASVDYGDGSGAQPLTLSGQTFALSHLYADSGIFTVTVIVTDDNGDSGADSAQVIVNNVAPSVSAGPDATINEGGIFTSSGSFADPGTDDTWTATVDYGDGSGVQALVLNPDKTFVLSHMYADDDSYPVTVAVTDDDGGSGGDFAQVTVNNVAPVVDAGPDGTTSEGGIFTSSGSFTDPGADSWTATVDYGDGSGVQAQALNPDKTFALSHVYADVGSFTVTVAVTDDDGGSGTDSADVTVPYGFIGLLSPYQERDGNKVYTIKLGSSFPVRWQYADPATGLVVESSGSLPEVQVLGPVTCNTGGDGTEPIEVFSPGNSTYQYDDRLDIHQLNVDTDNLQANKCYDAYVFGGLTQQLDGPFIFKIKR